MIALPDKRSIKLPVIWQLAECEQIVAQKYVIDKIEEALLDAESPPMIRIPVNVYQKLGGAFRRDLAADPYTTIHTNRAASDTNSVIIQWAAGNTHTTE